MKKEYRESEIRAHYRALTLWLIEQKLTITTMESATAGTDRFSDSRGITGRAVSVCNASKGALANLLHTRQ